MVSKTISLKKEAYLRLKSLKGKKSFSQVIMELTKGDRNDFSVLIGKNSEVKWEDVKKSRERTRWDKEREKILLGH